MNNEERTLLEMAAKAAGYEFNWRSNDAGANALIVVFERGAKGQALRFGPWNPLAYDDDAFRLAVKLGIEITSHSDTVAANEMHEDRGADDYAALRRAITRAAASIGASMKEQA